eukprot:Nk52_evm61s2192 gene=Nk52_evmTU61s2192
MNTSQYLQLKSRRRSIRPSGAGMTKVTDAIFSETSKVNGKAKIFNLNTEVASSLWLQVLMYCSVLYYPIFLAGLVVVLAEKFSTLDEETRGLAIAFVLVLLVIEPLRIYFGYVGNLSERIPELSIFWILSFVIQLPVSLYSILGGQYKVTAFDKVANIVFLLFLVPEIFIGYTTLKKLRGSQSAKFRLTQTVQPRRPVNPDEIEEIDAEVLI